MRQIAFLAVLALLTVGCTNTFRSDVTRFHKLPAPAGETVVFATIDANKADSLEFEQYADLIAPHLQALGYRLTDQPKAELVVEIDYDITEEQRTYYGAYGGYYGHYGGYYGHYGFHHFYGAFSHYGLYGYGRHYPYGYGGGYVIYPNNYYQVSVYVSRLEMKIRRANGDLLFEGSALSTSRKKQLPEVMPLLIEAMFADFPGVSGKTNVVKIDLSDRG